MIASPTTLRVLCPDGLVAEIITSENEETALRWARFYAANYDDQHDAARCDGPHRVERATWTEVPRDEVQPFDLLTDFPGIFMPEEPR